MAGAKKFFKKLTAALVAATMTFTMASFTGQGVLAGQGYTKEQLKSFVKEISVNWTESKGTGAKFDVTITLNSDAPDNVKPGELYVAAGKAINEEAVKRGFPSTFNPSGEGVRTENADGSVTYTFKGQGAEMWGDQISEARNALEAAEQAAKTAQDALNEAQAEEAEKKTAGEALDTILTALDDADDACKDSVLEIQKILDEVEKAESAYKNNKSSLVSLVSEETAKKLEDGLDAAEVAINSLKQAQEDAANAQSEAAQAAAAALAAAQEAADAQGELETVMGDDEQTFAGSMTAADSEDTSEMGGFLGASWRSLVYNMKTRLGTIQDKLDPDSLKDNACKSVKEAREELTGTGTYEDTYYPPAKDLVEDGISNLNDAKNLADETSKTAIEGIASKAEALKTELEKTETALKTLETTMGIETDKATVGVSLFPSTEGYDEVVFIGEVEKGKPAKPVTPGGSEGSEEQQDETEYTLTVYFVMEDGGIPPVGFKGDTVVEKHKAGETYNVPIPEYEGFTHNNISGSGVMPDANVSFTITYACAHLHTQWQYSYVEHWQYCSDCGLEINKEAHSEGKADYDFTKDGHTHHCHVCGYQNTIELAHKKVYDNNKAKLKSQHNVTCEVCNYNGDESHVWEHDPQAVDDFCTSRCKYCDATYTAGDHKFTTFRKSSTNGKHIAICSICGFEQEENCDMSEYEKAGYRQHKKKCSKCKAVDTVTEDCTFGYKYTGQGQHKSCCEYCGFVQFEGIPCSNEPDMSKLEAGDAGIYLICSDCNHQSYHQHSFGSEKREVVQIASVFGDGKVEYVKYCSTCGERKFIRSTTLKYIPGESSGGGGNKDKNKDTGAVPTLKPTVSALDNRLERLEGVTLGGDVMTNINDQVADTYFDLVDENTDDLGTLIEEKFGEGTDKTAVEVIVEPTVTIKPTGYDKSTKTLTVDIQATYTISLKKGDQEEVIAADKKIDVNTAQTLRVAFPAGFGSEGKKVNIKHTHNGETYVYEGTIVKDEDNYFLDFTSTHGFSPFEFTVITDKTDSDVVSVTYATGGSTEYYANLQEAVVAAEAVAGSTITLLSNVNVTDEVIFAGEDVFIDLNGHTLSVASTGSLEGYSGFIIESSKPGTFTNAGTIGVDMDVLTSDTISLNSGTVSGNLGLFGGNVRIRGGEVTGAILISNVGISNVAVTVSGDAQLNDVDFNIDDTSTYTAKLTLNGGYFKSNPANFPEGVVVIDPVKVEVQAFMPIELQDATGRDKTKAELENEFGWTVDSDKYIFRVYALVEIPDEGDVVQTYNITVQAPVNGTLTSDKATAEEGETVTLTATPGVGYKVTAVYYNDGTAHKINADASGKYPFIMPAKDVTVSAVFARKSSGGSGSGGSSGSTGGRTGTGTTGAVTDTTTVKTEDSAEPIITKDADGKEIITLNGKKVVSQVVKIGNDKYITNENGEIIKSAFATTPSGSTVYAGKNGKIKRGRIFKVKGKKYVASASGAIVKSSFSVLDSGKMVYSNKKGVVVTGKLFKVKGEKYIAKKSGVIVTDKWVTRNGKKYHCSDDGHIDKTKKVK